MSLTRPGVVLFDQENGAIEGLVFPRGSVGVPDLRSDRLILTPTWKVWVRRTDPGNTAQRQPVRPQTLQARFRDPRCQTSCRGHATFTSITVISYTGAKLYQIRNYDVFLWVACLTAATERALRKGRSISRPLDPLDGRSSSLLFCSKG